MYIERDKLRSHNWIQDGDEASDTSPDGQSAVDAEATKRPTRLRFTILAAAILFNLVLACGEEHGNEVIFDTEASELLDVRSRGYLNNLAASNNTNSNRVIVSNGVNKNVGFRTVGQGQYIDPFLWKRARTGNGQFAQIKRFVNGNECLQAVGQFVQVRGCNGQATQQRWSVELAAFVQGANEQTLTLWRYRNQAVNRCMFASAGTLKLGTCSSAPAMLFADKPFLR